MCNTEWSSFLPQLLVCHDTIHGVKANSSIAACRRQTLREWPVNILHRHWQISTLFDMTPCYLNLTALEINSNVDQWSLSLKKKIESDIPNLECAQNVQKKYRICIYCCAVCTLYFCKQRRWFKRKMISWESMVYDLCCSFVVLAEHPCPRGPIFCRSPFLCPRSSSPCPCSWTTKSSKIVSDSAFCKQTVMCDHVKSINSVTATMHEVLENNG